MASFQEWYESERPTSGDEPERYVVCAGLAVLERARTAFPLAKRDYMTSGNQVRTSGPLIQAILRKHGEERLYAREGARTTRRTPVAAALLAERLNEHDELLDASPEDRARIIDELQAWLVGKVREYFDRQRIEIEVNLDEALPVVVGRVLEAADERRLAGPVAQHLVGAKLSIRFPELKIENHSYTTADDQLRRHGDFLVGDTVYHVTVAPMPQLFEKCARNLKDRYRAVVLTLQSRVKAAEQMADQAGIGTRVEIRAIEQYVGQNIEELGEGTWRGLQDQLKALLLRYNERVDVAETNKALLVALPGNL